ncbi:MAG: ATP-binding cassette domain-containing protein [Acidimicrobiia bacterium]|nr:ATP-binding cassette domain-containing protein [Acidimicrobiia bacterium]
MTHSVIQIDGLVKTFGTFRALDGLDLSVTQGEIHGFLGPNGAGKSTTIRVLLGLMRATSGAATLLGSDPWADAAKLHERLAYVPGDVSLWPGLTGGQCLDVLASSHGEVDAKRRTELIERFDLDPTKKARDYSKGNRQKVALVAALSTHVELIIFDEPTSGLDPLMEQAFQEVVRQRKAEGVTVLLSSHILAEVEALADRVSIIRKGRTVQAGSLTDLRQHTRTTVRATVNHSPDGLATGAGIADYETSTSSDGNQIAFTVDPTHLDGAIAALHHAGIRTLTVNPPSLDSLFLRSYGEDIRERENAAAGVSGSPQSIGFRPRHGHAGAHRHDDHRDDSPDGNHDDNHGDNHRDNHPDGNHNDNQDDNSPDGNHDDNHRDNHPDDNHPDGNHDDNQDDNSPDGNRSDNQGDDGRGRGK